jgi:hypothetical protein
VPGAWPSVQRCLDLQRKQRKSRAKTKQESRKVVVTVLASLWVPDAGALRVAAGRVVSVGSSLYGRFVIVERGLAWDNTL